MIYLGDYPINATVYIPFNTFSSVGASVTITGLAVTDIEIYKDGSATQRASDAGYTLLDTDGIDFDGLTGLHGFSVDLSDNTDAGFYAAGHEYMVAISSITCDGQTVSFWAATFSIERAGGALALLKSATYGLSALKDILDTSGVVLGATQGAITWAQQKIVANADGEGALHITNGHVNGYGEYVNGGVIGIAVEGGQYGQSTYGNDYGWDIEGGNFTGMRVTGGQDGIIYTGTAGTAVIATGGTADYDPVLAIAGDEMDLIDAPNGTAIMAIDTQLSGTHGAGSWVDSGTPPTVNAIADQVWDEAIAGHLNPGSTGTALNTAGGAATVFPSGAIEFTYTVTDSSTTLPLEGVEVWISTDNPAVNIVWKGDTDAFGIAMDVLGNKPKLDPGTYYFWRQLAGYTFSDPDTEIVS